MNSIIGGRKVLLGFLLVAVGVAVDLLAKNGLSVNLKDLMVYIGGSFFLANGVEHIAGAIGGGTGASAEVEAPTAETPVSTAPQQGLNYDLHDVQETLARIEQQNVTTHQALDLTQQGVTAILGIATGRK